MSDDICVSHIQQVIQFQLIIRERPLYSNAVGGAIMYDFKNRVSTDELVFTCLYPYKRNDRGAQIVANTVCLPSASLERL